MLRLSARLGLAVLLTAATACSALPTGPDVQAPRGAGFSQTASGSAAVVPSSASGGVTPQGGYINPNI